MVVLVSDNFDGVPWLERVYVAGTLWDAYEMGAPADIHAYTTAEFERKLFVTACGCAAASLRRGCGRRR